MTHSGGKPHEVGDRGQRYEVTFLRPNGERMIFGWSDTLLGAEGMVSGIEKHPVWKDGTIRDRAKQDGGEK